MKEGMRRKVQNAMMEVGLTVVQNGFGRTVGKTYALLATGFPLPSADLCIDRDRSSSAVHRLRWPLFSEMLSERCGTARDEEAGPINWCYRGDAGCRDGPQFEGTNHISCWG
jgi:hypothetical protein